MKNILTLLCLLTANIVQAGEVEAILDWSNRRIAAFAVHGVVDKVLVAAGEKVKKDQLLAQLDQSPFIYASKNYQARIDGIKPRLFDTKQNYDQAQELYDRTVLSQVELQRAEVKFQGVEAEQVAARAELDIAKWQQRRSVLSSPCECMVVNNDLLPGMVINAENQTVRAIELAETSFMDAVILMDKNINLVLQQSVQVNVAGKKYSATVVAIASQKDQRVARVQFRLETANTLYAGQVATVSF